MLTWGMAGPAVLSPSVVSTSLEPLSAGLEGASPSKMSCWATPHCRRSRRLLVSELFRVRLGLSQNKQAVRMTLRYVEVTQQDLQREYHKARQNAA